MSTGARADNGQRNHGLIGRLVSLDGLCDCQEPASCLLAGTGDRGGLRRRHGGRDHAGLSPRAPRRSLEGFGALSDSRGVVNLTGLHGGQLASATLTCTDQPDHGRA